MILTTCTMMACSWILRTTMNTTRMLSHCLMASLLPRDFWTMLLLTLMATQTNTFTVTNTATLTPIRILTLTATMTTTTTAYNIHGPTLTTLLTLTQQLMVTHTAIATTLTMGLPAVTVKMMRTLTTPTPTMDTAIIIMDTPTMLPLTAESLKRLPMKCLESLTPPTTLIPLLLIATMDTNMDLITLLKNALVARSDGLTSLDGFRISSSGLLTSSELWLELLNENKTENNLLFIVLMFFTKY